MSGQRIEEVLFLVAEALRLPVLIASLLALALVLVEGGAFGVELVRRVSMSTAGDPLDGPVNLFELGIVLAVGVLLAVLSSLQLSGLLGTRELTIIRNPGSPQQGIVIKEGQRVRTLRPSEQRAIGRGRRVGSVYRLADGRTVYVTGGE